MIEWYGEVLKREGDLNSNGNPNRYPIAYAGQSFRSKWVQLKGRYVREQGKAKKPKFSSVEGPG